LRLSGYLMRLNPLRLARRRGLQRSVLVLATTLILWLCASWYAVHHLTRRARPPFAEPAPTVAWGAVESLQLQADDGAHLGAWFVPGPVHGPSVLLLHGNGESRSKNLPLVQFYATYGCSVLTVSLRAHGDSSGDINDIGYGARHDVVAAVAYLERRRPGRPIIVQGTSLGAAAAIYAAAALGTRVHGYILESAYADIRTAVRNRTENHLFFPFDRVAYAGLTLTGPLVLPDIDRMAPVEAIDAIPAAVPVVLLAGGRDRDARPEEAEALYDHVRTHGQLVWFPEARHESYYRHDPVLYRAAVGALLDATTGYH
jgi:alpha-beta hydrolase superfamily lysophospholipase